MNKPAITREEKIELIKRKLAKRKKKAIWSLSNIPVWLVDQHGIHSLLGSDKTLTEQQFEMHLLSEGLDRSDVITFQ